MHPVSQHQTLMARSSVEQGTLVAPLSRRRVLQGDGAVHADRVCDWKPGEIPQRDAQAHVIIQISGHMDHDAVWQNNPENAAAGIECIGGPCRIDLPIVAPAGRFSGPAGCRSGTGDSAINSPAVDGGHRHAMLRACLGHGQPGSLHPITPLTPHLLRLVQGPPHQGKP